MMVIVELSKVAIAEMAQSEAKMSRLGNRDILRPGKRLRAIVELVW